MKPLGIVTAPHPLASLTPDIRSRNVGSEVLHIYLDGPPPPHQLQHEGAAAEDVGGGVICGGVEILRWIRQRVFKQYSNMHVSETVRTSKASSS